MKPVKILHFIPDLSSGGAERQLANVVLGTSKAKMEHVVCLIGKGDFFAPPIADAGFKMIKLGLTSKRPLLRSALKFRRIVAQERPDVIHSRLFNANVASRFGSLFSGIPLITSLEAGDYDPEVVRMAGWTPYKVEGLRWLDKFSAWLNPPFFVPCSKYVLNAYLRNYGFPKERARVIYNGVDPALMACDDTYPDQLRAELKLFPDAFIFLNVSRLDPQKNHRVLIEGFKLTLAKAPNSQLLLAGNGPLEAELKDLADRLGISENVIFLGRRNDVGGLLQLADVFVFPSLFEGHPVALIEAMLKSLPCIASRLEVFEEVVTDGKDALLVNHDSAAELAEAMLALYRDKDLRTSLGENAYRNARDNFLASLTAARWEQLYIELAGRG